MYNKNHWNTNKTDHYVVKRLSSYEFLFADKRKFIWMIYFIHRSFIIVLLIESWLVSVVDCFVFCWLCCYCFWISFIFTPPYSVLFVLRTKISVTNFIIIFHLFIYICHQNAWQSCKFEFTAMTSVIKCILQWVGNRRLSSTH